MAMTIDFCGCPVWPRCGPNDYCLERQVSDELPAAREVRSLEPSMAGRGRLGEVGNGRFVALRFEKFDIG